MSVYISVRDVDFHASTEGVRVRVYTDIPCHIWCRLSTKQPWIHKKPVLRRGMWLNDDVRFCFTVYEDNEQFEPGDTLLHTFWKPDWPVCTTKWCYFWGYIGGVISSSTTALFKYHNDGVLPVPPPEVLKTFNPVDPEGIIVAAEHAWNTLDLTDYIHPDATGVILYWGFHQNVGLTEWKMRTNGQVFDHDARIATPQHGCAILGVDPDKKIQIFTSETLGLHVYVIGYTGQNVHFFDEPIDISPDADQTWQTQDLSADAPGADAIIGIQANYAAKISFRNDVRVNGSTDNYRPGVQENWFVCGCDATSKVQTYVWNWGLLQKLYATGYIVGDSSFYTNQVVLADPPLNVWTVRSVKTDLVVPIYGIVHIYDLGGVSDYGVKKQYGYFDPYTLAPLNQYWPIHCRPDGTIELKRSNANLHFLVTGETE